MILVPLGRRAGAGLGRLWLAGVFALLALSLVGCGVSTTRSGGNTGGSTQTAGAPSSGMTILPCPGRFSGGVTAAATLSNTSGAKSASVKTGDTILIRMDGKHSWKLTSVKPAATLSAEYPRGFYDSADGTCVWVFHASAPGDTTITFTGTALCDPTQTCPQYAVNASFTLHIS